MQREGKIWGTTSLLWRTPLIEIHKLEVVPGGFCSWHKHRHKWNAFIVHAGALTIEIRKEAYPLTDKTVLRAGDFTTVKPGEEHRFVAGLTSAVAFEIYYPEMLSEDIVRSDIGGIDEKFAPRLTSLATDLLPTGPISLGVGRPDDHVLVDNPPAHHQV